MRNREQQHPFYKPLWVRIAVTAVCAVWAGFELLVSHDGLFTVLSLAALGYALYTFFITWPKDGAAPPPSA